MAWTAPFSWTVGYVVTAAKLNEQLYYNMRYLKGLDVAVAIEDDLTVPNLITAGNVDGVDVSAHKTATDAHAADTTTAHGAVSAATASKIVIRDAEGQAAFAAPAAAGDALIKGTRHLIAEMPTLTTGKVWKGVGGVPAEAAPGITLTVATTEVFTGESPANWTNLDLSGTIGANVALVVLKIYNPYAGAISYSFRADGETEFSQNVSTASHSSCIITQDFGMVIVHAPASGIVEWISSSAQSTTTVDVVAYIK